MVAVFGATYRVRARVPSGADAEDVTSEVFAEAMSATPAIVPDEVRGKLLERLSRAQLAELAAEVAWENQRARLNQALGVRPAGFADGAACPLPE